MYKILNREEYINRNNEQQTKGTINYTNVLQNKVWEINT